MKKILCVCFSATFQRSIVFEKLELTQVNRSQKYELYASGKAVNSARVLNQLEKNCAQTICPLGIDNAHDFLELAQKDNLNLFSINVPGKIRECWTLLDINNNTTTELVVGEPALEQWKNQNYDNQTLPENRILKLINDKLDNVDALLLAGSKQGIWPDDMYATICGIALDKKKIVLADFVGNDLLLCLKSAVPSIIKINDDEFFQTFGLAANQENICKISKQYKNIIVVTRGTKSTLASENGHFFECETLKIDALNTTACGDSFNSGFLYEYLNTSDMNLSLKKGTWCAAQNAKVLAPGSIIED